MGRLTVAELYHVVLIDYKSEGDPDSERSNVKAKEHHVSFDVFRVNPLPDLDAFEVLRLNVSALKVVDVVLLCEN